MSCPECEAMRQRIQELARTAEYGFDITADNILNLLDPGPESRGEKGLFQIDGFHV